MKFNGIALALSLAIMGSTAAHAESVQVINKGYGPTLDAAIDEALRRSIEQVKGVSLDNIRLSETQMVDSSDLSQDQYRAETLEKQVMTSAGAATYRVLEDHCDPDGCQVKLDVAVDVPDGYERRKVMENMNKFRRTIVILPFKGQQGDTLSRYVRDRFVQDRKMSVLDYSSQKSVDYVLKGRMIEARTYKRVVDNSRTVKLTGEHISDVKTYFDSKVLVEYELIDTVNGQVKWSATVPTTSSRNNLDLLLNISADKVFGQLKENIYPLVAIKMNDKELVLNSGGNTIKDGQLFDLYAKGDVLWDPYTKEPLGYEETKVARVKATRVLPKLTYVEVVSGSLNAIEIDAIARTVKTTSRPAAPRPVSKPKPAEPEHSGEVFF